MEIIKIIDEKINFKCREFHFINKNVGNAGLISFDSNYIYIDDFMFIDTIKLELIFNNSDYTLQMLEYFKKFIYHQTNNTSQLKDLVGYKMIFKSYKSNIPANKFYIIF